MPSYGTFLAEMVNFDLTWTMKGYWRFQLDSPSGGNWTALTITVHGPPNKALIIAGPG